MPDSSAAQVCVVIAAYAAEATIGRAIDSALAQPDVAEVIVVDDASRDRTVAVAHAHDDGTGRLSVVVQPANAGPSAARNVAIAHGRAPYIAILDADDFLLPGRFAALLAVPDWDIVADNIAFVAEQVADALDPLPLAAHGVTPRTIDAAAFVAGCISRRGRYKGELGFLKPVLSRTFLDAHALRYDETMRLAEDYDLYVRALSAGARFRLAGTCGYVAVDRAGSLSSRHRLGDLVAFEASIGRLLALAPADTALRRVLRRHLAQTARKRRHRQLLERKRAVGLLRALGDEAGSPHHLAGMLSDVARDKLGAVRRRLSPEPAVPVSGSVRFLL